MRKNYMPKEACVRLRSSSKNKCISINLSIEINEETCISIISIRGDINATVTSKDETFSIKIDEKLFKKILNEYLSIDINDQIGVSQFSMNTYKKLIKLNKNIKKGD